MAGSLISDARNIRWFCDPFSINRTSTDLPLDADFRFELGVFADGFVPTAGNVQQWTANWRSAQRTMYNSSNRFFTAEFTVTGNAAPFSVGTPAYVWGFGGREGNEWILFRAPSWTWPAADPLNPIALSWNTAGATPVLGIIQSSGNPFLMKTAVAAASPPATSFAQWQSEMLNGVTLNGPKDDPDRDGEVNALEFVFGGNPRIPDPIPRISTSLVENNGQRFLEGYFMRRADRPASLLVEVSTNLTSWSSGSGFTETTTVTPTMLGVRSLLPFSSPNDRQFIRMAITISP